MRWGNVLPVLMGADALALLMGWRKLDASGASDVRPLW